MNHRYWKLEDPAWEWYETDDPWSSSKFNFRNGHGSMPYSIPGILCPNCKDWRLGGEFPFCCPVELKDHPYINVCGPMSIKKHRELIRHIEEIFEKDGIHFDENLMDRRLWLVPGTKFADVVFQIPCHPIFSFHWCMIGAYPVVNKDVKDAFEENGITGVTFHQVKMTYVGKANFDEWERYTVIPGWDDCIEDFFRPPRIIEAEEDPESFGPLYYFRVSHWGPDWVDPNKPKRYCKLCGREFGRRKPKNVVFTEKHILPGYDIFRSAVSQSIVVTEKVYQLFQEKGFTNAPLNELKIES